MKTAHRCRIALTLAGVFLTGCPEGTAFDPDSGGGGDLAIGQDHLRTRDATTASDAERADTSGVDTHETDAHTSDAVHADISVVDTHETDAHASDSAVESGGDGGSDAAQALDGGAPVPPSRSFDCWPHAVGSFDPHASRFWLERNDHSGHGPQSFTFGPAGAGWIPLAGDWTHDGADTVALYDPAASRFYLDHDNSGGDADAAFSFGPDGAGWLPLGGDWSGDGFDTVGLYAPTEGRFYLDHDNSGGDADVAFNFGPTGGLPLAGDWNGDGTDTVGVYLDGALHLAAQNVPGTTGEVITIDRVDNDWLPVAGDWDGDGDDDPGLFDPDTARFHLTNAPATATVHWPVGAVPLTGDWVGDAVCVALEAEGATTVEPPLQPATGPDVSGGSYLQVPDGSGSSGSATYDFTLPSAGSYAVWGRVSAATASDDSFYVSMDGGDEASWGFGRGVRWRWDRVSDVDPPQDPLVFALAAGDHQLRLRTREDGAAIDALLITDDASYIAGVRRATRVGDAWIGTRVGFDFVSHQGVQSIAYYDGVPNRVVAHRPSDGALWQQTALDPFARIWDSHNYLTSAWDSDGFLHLSGDMHVGELVYYRGDVPHHPSSLVSAAPMIDEGLEQDTTYPKFLEGPDGELLFMYRDGASGDGVWYINAYDTVSRTWSRYIDQPLFAAQGRTHLFLDNRPLPDSGCTNIAGDWSGNGVSVVGSYCPVTGTFHLPRSNQPRADDDEVRYGPVDSQWLPIVGDWDGDGTDTLGLYSPGSGTFFLRNSITPGVADLTFVLSGATGTLVPVAGDWNGDGADGVGLYDTGSSRFYLRSTLSAGEAELTFQFGDPLAGTQPLAGDWDGDGTDTVGLYRTDGSRVDLRGSVGRGSADVSFLFGTSDWPVTAVSGDWATLGRDTVGFCESPYVWLLEGAPSTDMNAYFEGPIRDASGLYHIVWVWRSSPDAAANHDVSYARSENLRDWTDSLGNPLALPITLAGGEVVAPVPAGRGLLNGLAHLGFDAQGRVVISYHRYDSYVASDLGNSQIYSARREGNGWRRTQATAWSCRWDFGGGGSLSTAVGVGAVTVDGARLTQAFSINVDPCVESGVWVLDEATLAPLEGETFWYGSIIPDVLRTPTLVDPGLPAGVWDTYLAGDISVSLAFARGESTPGVTHLLRWETLGRNRDLPRYCDSGQSVECQPAQLPSSELVVYELETFGP